MTRAAKALESFRSGRAGTVLFYSYLVAILIGAITLFHFASIDRAQSAAISRTATRSCIAIKGAGSYWEEVLAVENLKLTDEGISKIERAATMHLIAALEKVISKSHKLQCDGDSND